MKIGAQFPMHLGGQHGLQNPSKTLPTSTQNRWTIHIKINQNLTTGIITPDREIVENSKLLEPAYLTFDNYELILKWNRSLRFALAVCTLKDKFTNEL